MMKTIEKGYIIERTYPDGTIAYLSPNVSTLYKTEKAPKKIIERLSCYRDSSARLLKAKVVVED